MPKLCKSEGTAMEIRVIGLHQAAQGDYQIVDPYLIVWKVTPE